MLALAHVAIAGATNTPEMVLETDEAKTLANGIVPVLDQFDFVPDPRFVAAFGLVTACAKVYGPRVYLIRARHAAEAEQARAEAARTIFPTGGLN